MQLTTDYASAIAKSDSAASNHYWPLREAPILNNLQEDKFGPTVILPDTSNLNATQKGHLPIPHLSKTATSTSVFHHLHSPLISLGQLCDDDCEIYLNRKSLKVTKNNKTVLKGHRSTSGDGLWDIPITNSIPSNITPSPSPSIAPANGSINAIIRQDHRAKQDLASFHHGSLFSPSPTTLIDAVKSNFLATFPGLSANLVDKHLPSSVYTAAGHMRHERQGLRSTKTDSSNLSPPSSTTKSHDVICALVASTDKSFYGFNRSLSYSVESR